MRVITLVLLVTALATPVFAQNSLEQVWIGYGENTFDQFGQGCCGGDFNNDGYSDVLIGAGGWPGMLYNIGKDYLYLGSPDFIETPFLTYIGDSLFDAFDMAISNVNDVNGDQIVDFLIPAEGSHGGGWIELYYGAEEPDTLPDFRINKYATGTYDIFGVSTDSAGDVNGDGCNDFVIAGGDISIDYVYFEIYFGGAELDTIADWQYSSPLLTNYYFNVKGLGDVNGDGYDDILAYKPAYGFPALLFFGGDPMDTIPDLSFDAAYQASGVGDINDDGYADIVMYQIFSVNPPLAYDVVHFGGPDMDTVPDVELTHWNGTNAHSPDGFSCGDVNGDGINDIIASTTWNNPFVYVYLGSPWFNGMVDVWYYDYNMDDYNPVTGVGDVNGDGCCEIVVGVPNDGGRGKAFMLAGNPDLIDIGAAVDPGDLPQTPGWYKLDQNYPNPFNASTSIHFELGKPSTVNLTIYDLQGNRIRRLITDKQMLPGGYNISWNGKDQSNQPVSSGVYLLEFQVDQFTEVMKMVMMK